MKFATHSYAEEILKLNLMHVLYNLKAILKVLCLKKMLIIFRQLICERLSVKLGTQSMSATNVYLQIFFFNIFYYLYNIHILFIYYYI